MVLPTAKLLKKTSIKIISGDLRGRNDLKSKVSTLEELYDFFYNNTQKLHRTM